MARLTPKQDKFCNLYIELGNASEAYRQAYSCAKMKAEAIHVNASRLLEITKVALRIAELQASHRQRHNITIDDLLDELEEARQFAFETDKAAAAVSATMGKAKILGFDKQVIKLEGELAVKSGLGHFYGSDA
jgi:phage terminase small subunit